MKTTVILLAATAAVCGCTGKLEDELETLATEQNALVTRLDALEEDNRELREALATVSRRASAPPSCRMRRHPPA